MSKLVLFALCLAVAHAAKLTVRPFGQVHVPEYHGHVSTYQGQGVISQGQVPVVQGQVPVAQGQAPVSQGHNPAYQHVNPTHVVDQKPNVAIVHQDTQVNPDGSYHNVWESENGIKVQEEASVKILEKDVVAHTVTGSVSYTDNDGNPFVLSYTADEHGFHPQGEHLPVAPPLPPAIARALEYIATHPYVEKEVIGVPVVEAN